MPDGLRSAGGPAVTVTSTATRRGVGRANQDHAVVVDGAVAVLDGATSWLPQEPGRDGEWFARTLGAALAARLPGHGSTLPDLLAAALAEVRDRFGLVRGRSPWSTVSVVRWDGDVVEALAVGDSPVVVRTTSGAVDVLHDRRLEPTAPAERAAFRDHLRAGHGFDDAFGALLGAVQAVERSTRNVPGGFWVAETDPEAARQALTTSWPSRDVATVAVLTDGAAAGVLEYGTQDWAGLLDLAAARGPAAVVDAVHAVEQADPDGVRLPRTKRHDDKTLVVVTGFGTAG